MSTKNDRKKERRKCAGIEEQNEMKKLREKKCAIGKEVCHRSWSEMLQQCEVVLNKVIDIDIVMGDSVPQGGPQQVLGGLKSICCFRSPSPALYRSVYQDDSQHIRHCYIDVFLFYSFRRQYHITLYSPHIIVLIWCLLSVEQIISK